MNANSPILIIDSGLGGLTVVKSVHALMPHEQIVYFGDTARLPYGSKSSATVTTFVKQIIHYLRVHQPKHVLIACNTATALALPALRTHFTDLSISGVIDPGAKAAVQAAGSKDVPIIAVIATEATIRSKAYERAILLRRQHARILLRPTPLLVPLIEEGRELDDPVTRLVIEQYLQPMIDRKMDVLVLGCTHYPIVKPLIQRTVGLGVRVIDSAEQCAEDVLRRLRSANLLRSAETSKPWPTRGAWLKTFVTDNSPRFATLASRFLGIAIDQPQWVAPDELHEAFPNTAVRRAV